MPIDKPPNADKRFCCAKQEIAEISNIIKTSLRDLLI